MASEKGHTETVKALLDKGADVNAKDKDGETVLMKASASGYTEIVKALLDKGADVNEKAVHGQTALMYASGLGRTEIVKVLLYKGADMNAKSEHGDTALRLASERGYTKIVNVLQYEGATVKALPDKGADVNANDVDKLILVSLSYMDLCNPLFPVVPNYSDMIDSDSPFYEIALLRAQGKVDFNNPSMEYRNKIDKLIEKYPDEYLPYSWLAYDYAYKKEYDSALEVTISGLSKSKNKSCLAFILGDILKIKSNPAAIGWYLQSCLLANDDVTPYLFCAIISQQIGNDALYWRLLNAADVIDNSMKRSQEGENMRNLVRKSDMKELSLAFKKFETNMNDFLPDEHEIPKSSSERSVFLSVELDYCEVARKQLLRL